MTKYIDVVVCQHDGCGQRFLFQAPAWSGIQAGQRVVVDTKHGERLATVVECKTLGSDGEFFDLLVKGMGAKVPLKRVLATISRNELHYAEDEENADD